MEKSITALPWTFDHDPCAGRCTITGETYGKDWPITGNVKGMSLDGDGDYKPCFARVKFGGNMPVDAQRQHMAHLIHAANVHTALVEALAYMLNECGHLEKEADYSFANERAILDLARGVK